MGGLFGLKWPFNKSHYFKNPER